MRLDRSIINMHTYNSLELTEDNNNCYIYGKPVISWHVSHNVCLILILIKFTEISSAMCHP